MNPQHAGFPMIIQYPFHPLAFAFSRVQFGRPPSLRIAYLIVFAVLIPRRLDFSREMHG